LKHIVFEIVVVALIAVPALALAEPNELVGRARYCIYLLQADNTEWQLVRIERSLYFKRVIPRAARPDDRYFDRQVDYRCKYFEVEREEPGYIKVEGCGAFAAGWLVPDNSTTPPSIEIEPNTPKHSKWNIPYAEKEWYYIGAADDGGKSWWLSMGDSPIVRTIPGSKSVMEFRPAVLSRERKYKIKFTKIEKS